MKRISLMRRHPAKEIRKNLARVLKQKAVKIVLKGKGDYCEIAEWIVTVQTGLPGTVKVSELL